jgi:hypothetical protein
MTSWNYRWVSPHWEFLFYQEDAPDIPFSERNRESAATFLDILNDNNHDVVVRGDFYNLEGSRDGRFGFEMHISQNEVLSYRTETGLHFPTPAPGESVTAQGWFMVRATDPVKIAAYVLADKYDAHSRAWAWSLSIYERPYPSFVRLRNMLGGLIKSSAVANPINQ